MQEKITESIITAQQLLDQFQYDKAIKICNAIINDPQVNINPKDMEQVYKLLIKCYTRTKQKDNALETVKKSFEYSSDKQNQSYEIARVYHSLKDYESALKYFKEADKKENDLSTKAEIHNYIGRNYLKKMKPKAGYPYLKSAFDNKDKLSKLGYIYSYSNFGTYFHLMGDLTEARKYYDEAQVLLRDMRNLSYIFYFLDEINRIDPEVAYEYAVRDTLGITWLIDPKNNDNSVDYWRALISASYKWWTEPAEESHWKVNQLREILNSSLTQETKLNFMMGPNDLSIVDLYAEEDVLAPLWFIEFPTSVDHGTKFLKIRMNNQVMRDSKFIGYPHDNEFSKIERIVITIRTQWFQEANFDHTFLPNTELEWELNKTNPGEVWLKDLYFMDMGDFTKSEDDISLTCNIDLYFDAKANYPDIKTTNQSFKIPITRKNRLQVAQKYKKNHENALTLVIALASLANSLYVFLAGENIREFFRELRDNQTAFALVIAFPILLLVFGSLFLLRNTESKDKKVNVNEFE